MLPLDPTIYFIVIVPDGNPYEASLMQGFASSLCENSWIFQVAALSPTNLWDYTSEGQATILARRMSGNFSVQIYPQSPDAVRAMPIPDFMPFNLYFLPEEEKLADYEVWAASCRIRPTFIAKEGGDLKFSDLSPERLHEYFLARLRQLPDDIDPPAVAKLTKALERWKPPSERKLGYEVGGHGSVMPNISSLYIAGFTGVGTEPFTQAVGRGNALYIDQIVRTTNSILDERDALEESGMLRIYRQTPDLNLYAPGIYPDFFDMGHPPDMSREDQRLFDNARKVLKQQSGYNFTMTSEYQQSAMLTVNSNGEVKPNPHPLLMLRAEEINFGTNVMSVLAASEFSAVVRLPNDINRTSGAVRNFAEHYRSDAPTSRKRLRAFQQIQDRLALAFPNEFYELIRRSKTGVRVVSDAHLEWLNIDGLPLMMRKTCTRLPVTPGNLFVSESGPQPIIHLTPKSLRKVLLLDALEPSDPIAGIFNIAMSGFEKLWQGKLDVVKISIASEDDLINAINDFDGHIIVFDGHGGHERNEPGKLYLQGVGVDIWHLRERIKHMPPIVFLSACDTHAADRNHATIANGFINLGARTVLSSVFPIDARSAAIFTARFLYRISDYIDPAIKVFGQALRWSDIVSGMLKMQLMTDYLRILRSQEHFDDEEMERISLEANQLINGGADDPFEDIQNILVELGIERKMTDAVLQMAIANSDTISYLQIGRPETILIDDSDRVKEQLVAMAGIKGASV